MEGEAAAAVQFLVQNLIDLCKNEISQIRGLDKDAEKLAETLDMVKKYLNDAETRDITSGAIKSWLEKLEDVAFDADNVLDEINYHILSKQIKPKKSKVPSCVPWLKRILHSRDMALKIKEINENFESINKKAAKLGLVDNLANEPNLVIATPETASLTLDPIFVGRDDVVNEIVEMLTTDERAVSILPIVGMGGLGKTTLTRKVFNRLKDENRFGSHIWVHVSPNFDPIILFKKILKELTPDEVEVEVEVESKQVILSKLQKALKDKTYLLVLDDIWNLDALKWQDFINSLLGASCIKGNAIVVTTRDMKVASIVNTLHQHELNGLSEDECWSIIRAKTFGEVNVPSEFETIGLKIASRCQGLPLAANVVGGILSNQSKEKWRSIEEKWLSPDEGGDNIRKILRLSFDNLSLPSLKKCFAYCAVFPKGSKIRKRELIEFWMAEGFLQGDGRDEMESVGEKFINVLLHNSLLQVSERDDYGDVESCGMHDLVHDLACSVSSSSNSTCGSRFRYMTLGKESSPIPKEMAKSLRTLLFKGDSSGINFSDFSDLESLHVLRLDDGVKEVSSSIRKLIHLRHFDISWTRIGHLPDWIGEFFHLQTLRAHTFDLRKLPSTIKYLINLRHLYIDECVELPAGIGRLTSLQTLRHFPVGDENGCKIEELGSLNNLKGDLRIRNLERVDDKEEAEKANLFKKSKILDLHLEWNDSREGETNDENVLEGMRPHSDLRRLHIGGFKGKRFPLWTQKMADLNKLISLTLVNCKECEEIPMFTSLRRLRLQECKALEYLPCEMLGFSLEELSLVNLSSLKNLGRVNDCLPRLARLTHLSVYGVPEFMATGCLKISPFPILRKVDIDVSMGVETVDAILQGCCHSLDKLRLMGMESWECLPESIQLLTALSRLWLFNFGMEELPEWFGNLSSLKELYLFDCTRLRRLPSMDAMQRLTTLKELSISFCPELVIKREAADSEWPKVSHIPRIRIDGQSVGDVYWRGF